VSRRQKPERVHWQGFDPAAIGEGLLAGIDDISGDELVTKVARQIPQACEILSSDSRASLDDDKVLQNRPGSTVRLVEPACVLADEVADDPAIDEGQLRSADGPGRLPARPSRDALDSLVRVLLPACRAPLTSTTRVSSSASETRLCA
jgi:hypothetical protein